MLGLISPQMQYVAKNTALYRIANGLKSLGEYLCGRVPEMFRWFQSSLSFLQKGFCCLQASKASAGKGHTTSHMTLPCDLFAFWCLI